MDHYGGAGHNTRVPDAIHFTEHPAGRARRSDPRLLETKCVLYVLPGSMAIHCPLGFDAQALHKEVSQMYARLAQDPEQDFHFHRGPAYAASRLGYSASALQRIPDISTAVFAGVANPHIIQPIEERATVLDIGCGGGMDLLLAAQRVGPNGSAIGIDMTTAMLDRAKTAADALQLRQVRLHHAQAHELPIPDASVDHVISNGVLNLTTDKSRSFGEIFRVLRPGAYLQLADIVVKEELPQGVREDAELWAA